MEYKTKGRCFGFLCKLHLMTIVLLFCGCAAPALPVKPSSTDLHLVSSGPDLRNLADSAYCLNFSTKDAPSVTQCPVHLAQALEPQFRESDLPTGELPAQEHDWSVFDSNASYLQLVSGSLFVGAEYIITKSLDYKVDPTAMDDETLESVEAYCAGESSVHAVVESIDLGCSIRTVSAGLSGIFPKFTAKALFSNGHHIGASNNWWAQSGSKQAKSSCTQSRVVRVRAIPLQTFCDRHIRLEKYVRLKKQIAELRRTVDKITYESAEIKVRKQTLEERVARSENDLQAASKKLEEYRQISSDLSRKMENVKAKNDSNLELINNLKHEIRDKTENLAKLATEKTGLIWDLTGLKVELAEAQKANEVSNLKAKLSDLERKLASNRQDIKDVTQVIRKQEGKVEEIKKGNHSR